MDFNSYLEGLRGQAEALEEAGLPNLVVLASIPSTNDLARRIGRELLEQSAVLVPALVLAHCQPAGRGRRGNSWASPAGRGVYASLLHPLDGTEEALAATLLAAVGLCRALNGYLDGRCRLKWPNDLLVVDPDADRQAPAGGKIGGILLEALQAGGDPPRLGGAVIGFGVNHGGEPPSPGATGLLHELGDRPAPDLAELAAGLARAVMAELAHLGEVGYAVDAYRALSLHRPGDTLVYRGPEERIEGTFRGFDERGFLRLERDGEELLLAAGEVASP